MGFLDKVKAQASSLACALTLSRNPMSDLRLLR